MDTSIIIDILGNDAPLQEKLERIGERISTTVITKYELLKSKNTDPVEGVLSIMEVYEFDGKSAEICARIFKSLKADGKMINELDILIASIAIAHDELLITRDKDFKRIKGLKLLVL